MMMIMMMILIIILIIIMMLCCNCNKLTSLWGVKLDLTSYDIFLRICTAKGWEVTRGWRKF